jgi:hypothetical protein
MNNLTLPADAKTLVGKSLDKYFYFDGQNNTLTVDATLNVTSGQQTGLFGQNGNIKNLIVDGKFQINIGTQAAPVAAHTYVGAISGGAAQEFNNITNNADITVKAYGAEGDVRVYVGAFGSVTKLVNCTNNGDIVAEGYAGNFAVGGIGGRTNTTDSGLLNTGDITVTDTSTTGTYRVYVGGIYGNTAGNTLKNVKNTGAITVNGGRNVYVGGIQPIGTEADGNKTNYVDGAGDGKCSGRGET